MYEAHWLALAGYAFAMTIVYLVVLPDERVYATAGTGAAAWIIVALTARGVQRMTDAGETVPADAGVIIQLFAALLAILSILVVFLYKVGLYPPPDEDIPDDKEMKA